VASVPAEVTLNAWLRRLQQNRSGLSAAGYTIDAAVDYRF
jgi:hypothetical protein